MSEPGELGELAPKEASQQHLSAAARASEPGSAWPEARGAHTQPRRGWQPRAAGEAAVILSLRGEAFGAQRPGPEDTQAPAPGPRAGLSTPIRNRIDNAIPPILLLACICGQDERLALVWVFQLWNIFLDFFQTVSKWHHQVRLEQSDLWPCLGLANE